MKFAALGLSEKVLEGVRAVGYTEPTPIQLRAIPLVLSGKDVIGSAQTGTGKTRRTCRARSHAGTDGDYRGFALADSSGRRVGIRRWSHGNGEEARAQTAEAGKESAGSQTSSRRRSGCYFRTRSAGGNCRRGGCGPGRRDFCPG